jgi:N utilization substance protein A
MVNELKTAFNEIAEMRSLPEEVVLDALQSALVSAYRRDSGASTAQNIEARIDAATGRARIFVEKEVIDEDITSPNTEVTLEKARFYEPEAQVGDTVMVQVEHTTKKFGRIAAQTAKQVILQKIREAERNALYNEFIGKEGELTTGKVQSMNSSVVTLRLHDRAEAILPRTQQIPGERYRQHEQLRVFVLEVKNSNKGPQIVVSRSHRNMLRRLLEYEVPEISNGQVEIKSIAREAGYRSKVAVAALQEGIDPVGACVGMRGIRIQNIVKELHDEKIDVIEWSSDGEAFISKALSPARVTGVYLDDDPHTGRTAVVIVPDDQLSLAIGREGQNARLAAKLTGWRIDIKSVTETVVGALENLDVPPLDALAISHTKLIEDVQAIMAKRDANKAIMPEEYNLLGKFANLIEKRLSRLREEIREAELEQINAVRMTLPEPLFDVPVDILGLSSEITEAIRDFGTVGEVLLATLIEDPRLGQMLSNLDGNPLTDVQAALDEIMAADLDELVAEDVPVQQAAPIEPEFVAEPEVAEIEPEVEEPVLDAFVDAIELEAEAPEAVDLINVVAVDTGDEFFDDFDKEKKKSKDKTKQRRLVFDEESGEVVSKRRRKDARRKNEWDDDSEF